MKQLVNSFAVLNMAGIVACGQQDTDCHVVILNGRVIDPETQLDAVRNVGIEEW